MDRDNRRDFVTEIFEETALVLGGIVAVCPIDDEVVWRLVSALDALHSRVLRRIAAQNHIGASPAPPAVRSEPHPAIEEFLRKVRGASPRIPGGDGR
jgi:hypothetical protein